MSKAETLLNGVIFQAVCKFVEYIPKKGDSEIIKGISHTSKITIPGRRVVM